VPTKRQLLPLDEVVFEILWEPGSLGGAAQTVVDVLRLINRIAALKGKTTTPPVRWRWVRCDGRPASMPALAQLPVQERPIAMPGGARSARQAPADVIVVPGWMTRDGPEIDQWIARSRALIPRLQQTLAHGGALLGVYSGVVLLATAGCLQGRQFAAPWPFFMAVMRHAAASDVDDVDGWSDAPDWVSDRSVWTCATPVATAEAVLDLLGSTPLVDLASAARDVLIPEPLRQVAAVAHARSARRAVSNGAVERARRWLVQHLADPTTCARSPRPPPPALAPWPDISRRHTR
jgi:transcriptional regulator GlxA family with amidase domain